MKNDLFSVISKIIITVCFICISATFIYTGCQIRGLRERTERFQRWNDIRQQIDTTTQYNAIVMYEKMKQIEDSILNNK